MRIELIFDGEIYSFSSVKEYTHYVEMLRRAGEQRDAVVVFTVEDGTSLSYELCFSKFPGGSKR